MSALSASSQRERRYASAAPDSCPTMNVGTLSGDIPANVFVVARASVTAGLANEVDDVNQYALVMKHATATGTASRLNRTVKQITRTSPKVAMSSPNPSPIVGRRCSET